MNKNKTTMNTPKLRFPEFKDSGAWEEKPLGEIVKRTISKNKDVSVKFVLTNSATQGIVSQREYFDKDIANQNNLEGYYIVHKDDFVYNPRVSKDAPVGPIKRNHLCDGVMSPLYTVFSFTKGNLNFFEHYFSTTKWHKYLQSCSNDGVRHDRMNISNDDLFQMPLPFPPPSEQTKIADCLSSLDDLITAESEKLESLKQHKKGLMQNLFPQAGETTPRLRFPEFKGSGDWEEKKLGEVCTILNNHRKPITGSNREKGYYPYYGASGIVDYVKDFIFDEDLVLVGEDGAKWGAFEKTAFLASGRYWVNNHAHVLKSKDINHIFLENYLVMLDISPFVTGAAPPKLTLGKLKEIPIPISPSFFEQQKIADCLSSLDDLITAQGKKLESLKQHKKGLMQVLFV